MLSLLRFGGERVGRIKLRRKKLREKAAAKERVRATFDASSMGCFPNNFQVVVFFVKKGDGWKEKL